jgi:uncharacterized protein (TIGR02217 family)
MQAFHDILFPTKISFGATGGPERQVEIVQMTSGHEHRNLRLSRSRRRFDVGTGVRSLDDLREITSFFEARRGAFHAFRFRDPFDFNSCGPRETPDAADQVIGTGDGETRAFRLIKRYGEGDERVERAITKPRPGTVKVAVDGAPQTEGTAFAVDHLTGIVTFADGHVPAAETLVTAGYAFDIAARFDAETISISLAGFEAGQIPTIAIIEVL